MTKTDMAKIARLVADPHAEAMSDRRITSDDLSASGYPDTRKMVNEIVDSRIALAAKNAEIAALREVVMAVDRESERAACEAIARSQDDGTGNSADMRARSIATQIAARKGNGEG